jgi:hypothetical protein
MINDLNGDFHQDILSRLDQSNEDARIVVTCNIRHTSLSVGGDVG